MDCSNVVNEVTSNLRIVAEKVTLGQVFRRVLRCYPVNIIPRMLLSTLIHVLSGGLTVGPLVAAVPQTASPRRNNKRKTCEVMALDIWCSQYKEREVEGSVEFRVGKIERESK